jgi:hypothetical protein
VARELHRNWRKDSERLGALFSAYIPNYRNLMMCKSQDLT